MIKLIVLLCIGFVLSVFLGLSFMAHVGWLLYVSVGFAIALVVTVLYHVSQRSQESAQITLSLDDSEASQALQESFNQGVESFNYIQDTLPREIGRAHV